MANAIEKQLNRHSVLLQVHAFIVAFLAAVMLGIMWFLIGRIEKVEDRADKRNYSLLKELSHYQLVTPRLEVTSPTATAGGAVGGERITVGGVPRRGSGPVNVEPIEGAVAGLANPQDYKIVIYSHAYDGFYYVQPYVGDSDTAISREGKWDSSIHLGDRYLILLVQKFHEPRAILSRIPAAGEDGVIATKEIEAREE